MVNYSSLILLCHKTGPSKSPRVLRDCPKICIKRLRDTENGQPRLFRKELEDLQTPMIRDPFHHLLDFPPSRSGHLFYIHILFPYSNILQNVRIGFGEFTRRKKHCIMAEPTSAPSSSLVRTAAFQAVNPGSNPGGVTKRREKVNCFSFLAL